MQAGESDRLGINLERDHVEMELCATFHVSVYSILHEA